MKLNKRKIRPKRLAAGLLALVLTIGQIYTTGPVTVFSADDDSTTEEDAAVVVTDLEANGEGLWITEIYDNDVDRSSKNNTRETNGYESINLYTSTTDLMEFIEVTSTHEEDISLNDTYEVYYGDTLLTITDMDGNSDITISKGQAVILWNYRDDVTTGIPTEEEFREDLRVPDDALVLQVDCGSTNWAGDSTFTIKRISDGEVVSTFSVVNGTNSQDGYAVELSIPDFGSEMIVYRNMTLPSAGYVYSGQLNGLVDYDIPDQEYAEGVYITEINANDVSRESEYGTASDVMEYVEIINTTDHDIDLNEDIAIMYSTKEGTRKILPAYTYDETADNGLGSSEDCILPSGATAVFWCYRYDGITDWTSFPTEEEFRDTLGIEDDVYVFLFTAQNGLNNTLRSFEVYEINEDESKTLISSYTYQGGGVDLKDNKSVQLSVNPEGPEMLIYSANSSYDAGNVDYEQYQYIADDGSRMGLELNTTFNTYVPGTVTQGDDYRVYWTYTESTLDRVNITTYYRFNGEGTWYSVSETSRRVPNIYETLISADEIFSQDYIEFYVSAQNTYHKTITDVYRVEIEQLNDVDGIRTNISDGDEVSGTITITANDGGDNSSSEIYIDGTAKYTTSQVLEDGAYLTFDTDGRDSYFKNALTTTDDEIIAAIGKWQYMILDGQAVQIDSSYFTYNEEDDTYDVTLRFWAGTYGTTVDEYLLPDANREDFTITEIALRVPGGEIYLPTEIGPETYEGVDTSSKTNLSTDYDAVHTVGDSTSCCPYMDVSFSIPASETNAVGAVVDTTKLSNGEHTLTVTNGESTEEVTFIVDNAAPVIDLSIEDGSELTGTIVIDPQITEAYTLNDTVVLLDGEQIETPYTTTAYELGDGEHVISVYADDAAGNYATETATFTVDGSTINLLDAGADDITTDGASLYLTLESGSETSVTYYNVEKIETSDIETTQTDGILPYITYTMAVGDVEDDAVIYASWDGEASNSDDTHASRMYVLNTEDSSWDLIASADSDGNITDASFTAAEHVDEDGNATIIVQCTASSSLPQLDTTTDGVVEDIEWDGYSIPEDYDFSFVWETDTQYYAEEWQYHYLNINNWIVENEDELNIEYVIHTGDIVDDQDMIYEWENADDAMSILDDAGIAYGVLGGNHDVAAGLEDYENYYTYFGTWRFTSQETYGESYEDNLGHYDLISQGGQDFIILYMSWNIYQDEIDWMNEVLEKYSDRMAILCFHTYTRAAYSSGSLLDYYGELIQEYVVAENPNVFLVLNGHYHGSSYLTSTFDDDGDGENERTVYQICTDYQSGFEGGNEYLKLLFFDLDNDKIYINSYSPILDDYNYYDTEVVNISEDGSNDIDVDPIIVDVDFDTDSKTLLEESFSAYLCTGEVLGEETLDAKSGTVTLDLSGLSEDTTYYWYAEATNINTGYLETGIYSFTTKSAEDTSDDTSADSSNQTESETTASTDSGSTSGETSTTVSSSTTSDTSDSSITVKKTKVKKAVRKKSLKKIKVTLKKIANASYYKVQVSKKKNFKKKNIILRKKLKKNKQTIKSKKLKSKYKKLYIRARAVAVVNGKKYKGKWSKVKKVKTQS